MFIKSAPKHVSVFTPFFLPFSIPFLLFIFSWTLSSSSPLLFLSSFLFFSLYFLPSIPTSSLPTFLPALSAHSSATIEAIEAIEVKDAEGKTLTHLTLCVCTRVCVYACACVRVCSMAALSAAHAHEVTLPSFTHEAPSSSSSSSPKPTHGHQHQHTSPLLARLWKQEVHTPHDLLHDHSHHLHHPHLYLHHSHISPSTCDTHRLGGEGLAQVTRVNR